MSLNHGSQQTDRARGGRARRCRGLEGWAHLQVAFSCWHRASLDINTRISPPFAIPRWLRSLQPHHRALNISRRKVKRRLWAPAQKDGRLQGCCSPPPFLGAVLELPSAPGCAGRLWLGLPLAWEKPAQFICASAAPFLWAAGFLCWYPCCNVRALYLPLPLFQINPVIFIKRCYLWLLTYMRDAKWEFSYLVTFIPGNLIQCLMDKHEVFGRIAEWCALPSSEKV